MYFKTQKGTIYETREDFFKRIEEKVEDNIKSEKASEKQISWAKRIALQKLSIILNYADDESFSDVSNALKASVLAIPNYINNPIYWIDNVEMNAKFKHELELIKFVAQKMPEIKSQLMRFKFIKEM